MFSMIQFIKKWFISPGILHTLNKVNGNIKLSLMSLEDKQLLKENLKIKNKYSSSRCFIMGAGSSVKSQDMKKLEGEFVISVSNTFAHPDFKIIKSKFHVIPPLLKSHLGTFEINDFIQWLKVMESATGDAEMFIHIGDRVLIEENCIFKNRIIHWVEYSLWDGNFNTPIDLCRIPDIGSVSEVAISVAMYLGFEKIYLIGIDHDWFNGLFIYFYDQSKDHVMQADIKSINHIDSEYQMRRHSEIFKKYKYLGSLKNNIYNANSNNQTYLDVFPKVDYDTLFGNNKL